MTGAILGDIIGSRFEWRNNRSKDFELFAQRSTFTDDSVMTIAVAKALLECAPDFSDLSGHTIRCMRLFGREYKGAGYGRMFKQWLMSDSDEPINSFGNGSAMRVSACAQVAQTMEQAMELAHKVTVVTHNHPEGIKGAQAVTAAIFLAKQGAGKDEIRTYIEENFYPLDFTLDEIRESYSFSATCQGSVPQAIEAFLESDSFEDAIRCAISIGGDSDTIAAMAGSIAEEFYGIPTALHSKLGGILYDDLMEVVTAFESRFPPKLTD